MLRILIIFLILSSLTQAKENFTDHTHRTLSKKITTFAESIDNFFGTKKGKNKVNKSKVRIYVDTLKTEGEIPTSEGNVKLQLVLPKTQDRLRFVLESEDDDQGVASSTATNQKNTGRSETAGEKVRDATTAGFRYITDSASIKSSIGTGIIFDTISPRPFYRVKLYRDAKFGKWKFRPQQEILWVSEKGHSTDTDLDLDKTLNHKWLFRFVNNIQWNDTDYIINFQNGPSWFQKINETIGLSYNAHIFTSNQPVFEINNYSLSIGYRQLLYKKWFFWTLSPAINFPRDNNFHRTPSIAVRFEAIVGHI
jgi:hypothetical protein